MNTFLPILLSIIVITGSLEATTVKDFGVLYNMKRLFGASSARSLAKMSQADKDDQLLFYAQKEWWKPQFILPRLMYPDFMPFKKHFNEIVHLIKHGANVNLDIPYRWWIKFHGTGTFKPIYLFIRTNDLERTRILLEHGATTDAVINSRSGLSFAQTPEMIQLLTTYGAHPTMEVS